MADTKISALTAATSVGTSDIFPIVQAGTTKKATISLLPLPHVGNMVFFTTPGTSTYTPTSGTRALWVKCVGGGGGAGGATATTGNAACVGGGGGGGCAFKYLTGSLKVSYSVTIGSGGAGGAAAGGTGSAGGDTTFDSPSVCTAKGGWGSGGINGGGTTLAVSQAGDGGGVAGGMVGDITLNGQPGSWGMTLSGTGGPGGAGGAAACGGGGGSPVGFVSLGAGGNGQAGGGAGGGIASNNSGNSVGANGGSGFIVVMEFF